MPSLARPQRKSVVHPPSSSRRHVWQGCASRGAALPFPAFSACDQTSLPRSAFPGGPSFSVAEPPGGGGPCLGPDRRLAGHAASQW